MIEIITEADYKDRPAATEKGVLLFFKKLCPHCKNMEKVLEKFGAAKPGIALYGIDIEENAAAAAALFVLAGCGESGTASVPPESLPAQEEREEIPADPCYVLRTRLGYLKRLPPKFYAKKEESEDAPEEVLSLKTDDKLLFFTSLGFCYTICADQIPEWVARDSYNYAAPNERIFVDVTGK